MPFSRIIYPKETLIIEKGPQELAVTNGGSGTTKFNVIQAGVKEKKFLEGASAMQLFENVKYPIEIYNKGREAITLT